MLENISDKSIKTFDRATTFAENYKDNISYKYEESSSSSNANNFATNQTENMVSKVTHSTVNFAHSLGNIAISNVKNSFSNIKNVFSTKKNLKTVNYLKNVATVEKETIEIAQRNTRTFRSIVKDRIRNILIATKITGIIIKAIFSVFQFLFWILFALFGIVFIAILFIAIILLLLFSIYGIFFSNEEIVDNNIVMPEVVDILNDELDSQIENIKASNVYDDCYITYNKTAWEELLAVYAVKTYHTGNNLLTVDDVDLEELKSMFWEMNVITYELLDETDDNGNIFNNLYINIDGKSAYDYAVVYNFTDIQIRQLNELLDVDKSIWLPVIYGVNSSNEFVSLALAQVGNTGEEYWGWYGFDSEVDWCAIFVSWLADKVGYLDTYTLPRFSVVSDGIEWFKSQNLWEENTYTPNPGDIIFFDWEADGKPNHVGIVERVDNDIVYTIEGNSTDGICRQKEYSIYNEVIYGYGILRY